MTNVFCSKPGSIPKDGNVGPYWFVQDGSRETLLVAHRCSLADAEEYGECLTSPHGHYDLWESWRAGSAPEGIAAIVREAEYEEWPRGRVVYNFVKHQFIVYGDKQVFDHKLQHRVLEYFGIPPDLVEFWEDEHYQSVRLLHPR